MAEEGAEVGFEEAGAVFEEVVGGLGTILAAEELEAGVFDRGQEEAAHQGVAGRGRGRDAVGAVNKRSKLFVDRVAFDRQKPVVPEIRIEEFKLILKEPDRNFDAVLFEMEGNVVGKGSGRKRGSGGRL